MATPYALFVDVQARAGRFQTAFAGGHPNQSDVELLLSDTSAEVDTAIRARGYDLLTLDAGVKAALKDVVAYGALARAVAAIPDSSDELAKLLTYAQAVWGAAMGDPTSRTAAGQAGSIQNGTFPAIAALEAGVQAGGSTAGSFWDDEPDFGTATQVANELATIPAELAPTFARSQTL